jgi:hypothetical protein
MALIAAASEPDRGWGGPLAILIAFTIMWVIHLVVQHRAAHSPPPPRHARIGDNAQVGSVPDTDDPAAVTPWWGRIVTIDGQRIRQVWRTGSSEVPDEPDDEGWLADWAPADDDEGEAEDIVGWVRDYLDAMKYADLVRAGVKRWGVSERTMKRRIAEARKDPAD